MTPNPVLRTLPAPKLSPPFRVPTGYIGPTQLVRCVQCQGTGMHNGVCAWCEGTGEVRIPEPKGS